MSDITAMPTVPNPVERPTCTAAEAAVIQRIPYSTLPDAPRNGAAPCIRVGLRFLVPTARQRQTNHQSVPTTTARHVGKYVGGLGSAEVRELVETTDIPHRKVKGHLRLDIDELQECVDRNTVPASGPTLSLDELATQNLGD